jgi:preprotein translocase subunit SecF
VITLLPIAALYVFGGATLQDFAFAIVVGITVGAVGTIFIATPLLATLLERDPAHAARTDDEAKRPAPLSRPARRRPSRPREVR